MTKWIVLTCIILLTIFTGCVNVESPQSGTSHQSTQTEKPFAQQSDQNYQTNSLTIENSCPPSISNCNFIRGAANQITIQCNDGRQYIRGAAGQITIQYPGKQIIVGTAGQETIQGFDYNEAQCLIRWMGNI